MSQQQHTTGRPQEEEINLREELEKYLKYWPWFVLGVIICVAAAFAYLKFSIPTYSTTASIIIKDEDSKSPSSEMAAFADLGLLNGMGTNSIENEIGILKSRRMMANVTRALDLNIRYFEDVGIKTIELYSKSPFIVQVLKIDEELLSEIDPEVGTTFRIEKAGKDFQLKNINTAKVDKTDAGRAINLGFAEVLVQKNELSDYEDYEEILVNFSTIDATASNYREKLQINLTDKNSTLIELGLEDQVREKARDVLDQLVMEYNREAIEDKNLVARNTAKFIDERLSIINEELDSVETGKEEFKESNSLTDIEAESSIIIENASEYNKRQAEVGTQLELANAMISYINNDEENGLLPSNLGIQEEGVNQSIIKFNELVLERNRILSGSTAKNPLVIRLNSQIEQIKANVLQSLERMRSNLRIAQKDLDRQSAVIGSKIAAVPSKEREYRGIERQQNIKEALYLFLLQKREENSLSLAVTAPKAKIVDRAYSSKAPVSPKPKIILLAALILGIMIPFLIIYIRNLLNNKIRNRADIERAAKEIPIVGEVPKVAKNQKDIIEKSDRSILAEAFRILHTNLQYLLVNSSDKKTGIKIFITSTVKGEGKTFTAFNLAMTLANSGKKVVVVGGDLRNPQLQRYETQTKNMLGVSDFLVNGQNSLESLIKPSKLHSNLFLLASGSIPPNPAELWRQDKTATLFIELESKFDYVIVDTAPSMLVADTFLINKYADLTLYMIRAGYTEKKLQEFALDAKRDGKLHDVGFVLNDVELSNFGYGNKYGYSYGAEEEGFWSKLKNKAAFW
ncbi:polysaccharide biosynthesis tyrosine autokinase [Zunongwangia sp. F363]|uniref:non-specific protein-tyrosine kinase n=1 Tax=Autumnicola tepida TaxID=3075595 RepID=A0ABU3C7H6_9FLAO|nr:polysaccharide biosynthesis tyrosine autokinase [Zunongwangia sp. F363]MDT0642294.1 polysaccharide biosynthesis tyrosine autokinase [Zunongwangia sp. F363]